MLDQDLSYIVKGAAESSALDIEGMIAGSRLLNAEFLLREVVGKSMGCLIFIGRLHQAFTRARALSSRKTRPCISLA